MCCGHTMLTARSKRGVEFPEVLVLVSLLVTLSLSHKATFKLFLFEGVSNSQIYRVQSERVKSLALTTCGHVSCAGTNSAVAHPRRREGEVTADGANGSREGAELPVPKTLSGAGQHKSTHCWMWSL